MTYFGSREFFLEVAKGNVAGHSIVNKFGRSPDIDTADGFSTIYGGTKGVHAGFNSTAAEPVEVFSSSANDASTLLSSGTATGGSSTTLIDTGATFSTDTVAAGDLLINDTLVDHAVITGVTETTLTVWRWAYGTTPVSTNAYRVATAASTGLVAMRLDHLLGASYAQTSEYILTNGTTGVDTTGSYIRCARMSGLCAGNINGANIGTITLRQKTTTANVFDIIQVGYNQTMNAAYTIPAGKTGYMIQGFIGFANKTSASVTGRLLSRPVGEVFRVGEELTLSSDGTGYVQRPFPLPKGPIPEMTDILAMADTDTNNVSVNAGFDILLVDN